MSLLCSDFGVGFYFNDTLILCVYSCAAEFTISRKQSSFLFKTFIKRILEKWNIKDFRNNTSWSINIEDWSANRWLFKAKFW